MNTPPYNTPEPLEDIARKEISDLIKGDIDLQTLNKTLEKRNYLPEEILRELQAYQSLRNYVFKNKSPEFRKIVRKYKAENRSYFEILKQVNAQGDIEILTENNKDLKDMAEKYYGEKSPTIIREMIQKNIQSVVKEEN